MKCKPSEPWPLSCAITAAAAVQQLRHTVRQVTALWQTSSALPAVSTAWQMIPFSTSVATNSDATQEACCVAWTAATTALALLPASRKLQGAGFCRAT
ncbi:hypothetical protein OEZ86_010132 [Tetradesmus obliquus]|nr:hypothetical protein OEZ86_010132 [Tetradesmus obliquus]